MILWQNWFTLAGPDRSQSLFYFVPQEISQPREEVAPLVVENVAWKRSLPLLELCQVDHDDDDDNALQLQ